MLTKYAHENLFIKSVKYSQRFLLLIRMVVLLHGPLIEKRTDDNSNKLDVIEDVNVIIGGLI